MVLDRVSAVLGVKMLVVVKTAVGQLAPLTQLVADVGLSRAAVAASAIDTGMVLTRPVTRRCSVCSGDHRVILVPCP
jgi:hypothetical protein